MSKDYTILDKRESNGKFNIKLNNKIITVQYLRDRCTEKNGNKPQSDCTESRKFKQGFLKHLVIAGKERDKVLVPTNQTDSIDGRKAVVDGFINIIVGDQVKECITRRRFAQLTGKTMQAIAYAQKKGLVPCLELKLPKGKRDRSVYFVPNPTQALVQYEQLGRKSGRKNKIYV